ncbi:MAG: small multi-drug export protein [Bacilli bacterium]|nr:small multi-drug export protein [Bacilli bacterium]MBR6137505.1 small multi-drug export protein [Bacilli bacterium]
MVEKIVEGLLGLLSGLGGLAFGKQLMVFIISLMPILELRGGLIAAALLKLNPVESYIISIIGNILPVPFILWFINKILEWMRTRKHLSKIAKWLDKKVEKNRKKIEKYGFWGLVLFVGTPLPGTGAWTGCLVAAVLEMDRKKAFLAAMIGIFIASIIMMILSFGVLSNVI